MKFSVGEKYIARIAGAKQDQVTQFGRLMGTAGRIHTDPEWAASSPAGGILVQGGLMMSPLHELMARVLGAQRWLRSAEVTIKVISFIRLEEDITLTVGVEEVSDAGIKFEASWRKDDGTAVMVATVTAPQ